MPSDQEVKSLYKKFIIGAAVFLTIPVVAGYFVLQPMIKASKERTESNIEKLTGYLSETGVPVLYKDECKERVLGYFAPSDLEVVLCSNNLDLKDRGEVWRTLVHEAVHVMQACNGGVVSNDKQFKYMEGQLTAHQMDEYLIIHSAYAPKSYEEEVEARFYEIQFPEKVFDDYDKFCSILNSTDN
tara:strand:- start:50 stop:604 length:555 start_codon:yes stop_codon:yes gene_type:complete